MNNFSEPLLFAVGASHKSVAIATLERLAQRWMGDAKKALDEIASLTDKSARELCVLSTCNRFEVYGVGSARSLELIKEVLSDSLDEPGVYAYSTSQALRHAFWVAGGLDSMVLGETEILGQMKTAYETARQAGFTQGVLNTMFQKALYVGKRVRSETKLSAGRLSVASVAVDLAGKIFEDFSGLTVAVVGAGQMGVETAKNLLEMKPKKLIFLSRTLARAQALAADFGGEAADLSSLLPVLTQADIAITQLSAPKPVVTRSLVVQATKGRSRSLFLLDIALPGNIEKEVSTHSNVYLYTLDDLKGIVDENYAIRQEEAARARYIIEEEISEFLPQCHQRLMRSIFAPSPPLGEAAARGCGTWGASGTGPRAQ